MKFVTLMTIIVLLIMMLLVVGCGEVKQENDVISGESPVGLNVTNVTVDKMVLPDDGLDGALGELDEFEGNRS